MLDPWSWWIERLCLALESRICLISRISGLAKSGRFGLAQKDRKVTLIPVLDLLQRAFVGVLSAVESAIPDRARAAQKWS